jgi:mRNA interferase MazF
MITSTTRRSSEPTQLFIEISTPEGKLTGLRQDSVVNCLNLFTIPQIYIINIIGKFSAATMQTVNDCLKVTLEIR